MFLIRELILVACFLTPIILTDDEDTRPRDERCQNINCECFEDIVGIEYHCPNYDWHRKLVVQKNNTSKELKWTCMDTVDGIDKYLPNIKLKSEKMLIQDCSLTFESATNIDFDNLEELRILNSNISSGFSDVVRLYTSHGIEKIVLKYVRFDEDVNLTNFSGLELKNVDLSGVDIKFGSEIFRRQTELHSLSLKSNDIRLLKEDVFEGLFRLRDLDLSNNNIVYLHANTFKFLGGLNYLSLGYNHIEYLEKSIFRDLFMLVSLDLSNNNIRFLHRDVLKHLEALSEIDLSYNEGLALDDYLFSKFSDLKVINIQASNLKELPETLFVKSPKITMINLEKNSISRIPYSLFDGLYDLEVLILKDNDIRALNGSVFKDLWRLNTLDLSGNKLTYLSSKPLAPLKKLVNLDVKSNSIRQIGQFCFADKDELRKIDLSYNEIRYNAESRLRSPFVFDLKSLESVDLSSNSFEAIPYELIEKSKTLETLELQGNKIRTFDVEKIWRAAYKGMMVNVEDNRISQIIFDKNAIPAEPTDRNSEFFSYVFMAYNPMNCDCSAKAFLDFINEYMERSPEWGIIFVFKDLQCATPKNMEGMQFLDISNNITDCAPHELK